MKNIKHSFQFACFATLFLIFTLHISSLDVNAQFDECRQIEADYKRRIWTLYNSHQQCMGRKPESESFAFFDAGTLTGSCGKSQCNSIHNQTYRLWREYYDVAAPSCSERVLQKQKAERDAKAAKEKAEEDEQKRQKDAEDAERRKQARIQEDYNNHIKSQQEENQRRQEAAMAAQKAKEEADRQREQERLENNRRVYEDSARQIEQSDKKVTDQTERNIEQMAQQQYENRSVINTSSESQRIGLNSNSPPLGTGGFSGNLNRNEDILASSARALRELTPDSAGSDMWRNSYSNNIRSAIEKGRELYGALKDSTGGDALNLVADTLKNRIKENWIDSRVEQRAAESPGVVNRSLIRKEEALNYTSTYGLSDTLSRWKWSPQQLVQRVKDTKAYLKNLWGDARASIEAGMNSIVEDGKNEGNP